MSIEFTWFNNLAIQWQGLKIFNPYTSFLLVSSQHYYGLGRDYSASEGFSIDSTIRFSINSFAKSLTRQMWIARTMLYSIYKGSLLQNIARRNARKCNMKEEDEIWKKSLSHTVWECKCKCHIVWIHKKRRKTFNGF